MTTADEQASVTAGGATIPVEIFRPTRAAPWPGLLVIHEIFGLNDDIRQIARRFAKEGYLAVAPDLMAAGLYVTCLWRAVMGLQTGSGPVVAQLEAVIEQIERRPDVGKVGAVGFCMGGGFALLLGTRQRIEAAGVYYGETRTKPELARTCPVMGGYGAEDRAFASKARRLVGDLDALGIEHDVKIYEGVGHSYMNRAGHHTLARLTRPLLRVAYDAEAAEDSWRRMLAFFARHLGAATDGSSSGKAR